MSGGVDRVLLLTGAASGIGAATATRLAAPSLGMLLHSRRNEAGLEAVAEAARRAGAEVVTMLGDLQDPHVGAALVARAIARPASTHWYDQKGGYSKLDPQQQAAARAAHEKWPARSGLPFSLESYTQYVQLHREQQGAAAAEPKSDPARRDGNTERPNADRSSGPAVGGIHVDSAGATDDFPTVPGPGADDAAWHRYMRALAQVWERRAQRLGALQAQIRAQLAAQARAMEHSTNHTTHPTAAPADDSTPAHPSARNRRPGSTSAPRGRHTARARAASWRTRSEGCRRRPDRHQGGLGREHGSRQGSRPGMGEGAPAPGARAPQVAELAAAKAEAREQAGMGLRPTMAYRMR